jgi:hypothetical protein
MENIIATEMAEPTWLDSIGDFISFGPIYSFAWYIMLVGTVSVGLILAGLISRNRQLSKVALIIFLITLVVFIVDIILNFHVDPGIKNI